MRRDRLPHFYGLVAVAIAFIVVNIVRGEFIVGLVEALLCLAYGAFLLFSKREEAQLLSSEDLDERQRSVQRKAVDIAFSISTLVAAVGTFVEIARDDIGGFTVMASVMGFSYIVATFVTRRRES